jgi:hypothetical protein
MWRSKGKDGKSQGTLKVTIVGARALPAMDTNGYADPYVVLTWGGQKFNTTTKKKTLDPTWGEEFTISVPDASSHPPLDIAVWDWDRFNANDLIGSCQVAFGGLQHAVPHEQWYALTGPEAGDGEICVRCVVENISPTHGTAPPSPTPVEAPPSPAPVEAPPPPTEAELKSSVDAAAADADAAAASVSEDGLSSTAGVEAVVEGATLERVAAADGTDVATPQGLRVGQNIKVTIHGAFLVMDACSTVIRSWGFYDPFCEIRLGSQTFATKVRRRTVNPMWRETFEFTIADPGDTTLHVVVKDYDEDDAGNSETMVQGTYDAQGLAVGQARNATVFLAHPAVSSERMCAETFQWGHLKARLEL